MDRADMRASAVRGALFSGLEANAVEALLERAYWRQFAEGSTLFHQGDAPSELFQVCAGSVKMSQSNAEGAQTTLRLMRPGDLVGCVAVFRRFPYPATAIAQENTAALCWGAAQILDIMNRYPAVTSNALKTVGDRTKEMVDRVIDLKSKTAEQRIATVLLRLATQAGRTLAAGVQVELFVTRKDLAEAADVTYFTVSRTLSVWERQGMLLKGRARLVIVEPEKLAGMAGGPH